MRINKLLIASLSLVLSYTAVNADPITQLANSNNSTNTKQTTKKNKHTTKAKSTKQVNKTPVAIDYSKPPRLYSHAAYVVSADDSSNIIIDKNSNSSMPIASITKLMTAMVMLDSKVNLDDYVTITQEDVDDIKNTHSRLKVGMQLRRRDLLLLALMSSENRAAFSLARTTFKGGIPVFVKQMNAKAKSIGMTNAFFEDPTGLSPNNRASAKDLAKMVAAAYNYPLIREDSTTKAADVMLSSRYTHRYINSDPLVRADSFQIEVSKTGFINEAGHCLVLYSVINSQPYAMVFLNSAGKSGRVLDAQAVKNYISRK